MCMIRTTLIEVTGKFYTVQTSQHTIADEKAVIHNRIRSNNKKLTFTLQYLRILYSMVQIL